MIAFICTMVEAPDDQVFMIDLYHKYKRLMLRTAKKYVADDYACEDIIQDSLIKLIQNISKIRTKECSVWASYIVSTVRNTSIDYLRKQGRAEKYLDMESDVQEEAADRKALSLDEMLLMKERQAQLYSIWPQLSEPDQTALRGKYILEYTDAELASLLGCKESSVRTRLSRARRRAFLLLSQTEKACDRA